RPPLASDSASVRAYWNFGFDGEVGMGNLTVIENDIYGARSSFASVLTDSALNFEREAEFAIQTIQNNDYAAKIALSNRQSVANAVTNIAAIGISLNPAKRQA